jgi:membrane protein implicated in regulation of membrane protease activity
MKTTLSFSKLLGGTWLLWLIAVACILGTAAIFSFWPETLLPFNFGVAIALIVYAVLQTAKNENEQYKIRKYKEILAKKEKEISEIKESKISFYKSAMNVISEMNAAIGSRMPRKPRKKKNDPTK